MGNQDCRAVDRSGSFGRRHQPVPDRVGDDLRPIAHVQLVQNVAQVELDRALTHDETLGQCGGGCHAPD